MIVRNELWPVALSLFVLFSGCRDNPPSDQPHHNGIPIAVEPNEEAAREAFPPATRDYFADIDGKVIDGKYLPLSDEKAGGLSQLEIEGRNAWMLWTGGNERFWDWLSRNGYGSIDLLKVIDSANRDSRFRNAGLINQPGMRAPTKQETEQSWGIRFDRPDSGYDYDKPGNDYFRSNTYGDYYPNPDVYGYPTGIIGLRIFNNPEFLNSPAARSAWKRNQHRFYSEKPEDREFASNPLTIKPFLVGMSCAICHASHHPLNPPADPEHPQWQNISSTIGAQYLRIREVFGNNLRPDDLLYHVIDSQIAGTVDTSLVATDQINNANTMNAIFGLKSRITRSLLNPPEMLSQESVGPDGMRYPGLWGDTKIHDGKNTLRYPDLCKDDPAFHSIDLKEKLEDNPRHVPRVLVDGSDSNGTWIALARVYLNIGTYHQQWVRTHNTILGFRDQSPFSLADCEENSVYWHATKLRVDSMTAYFLKSTDPMLLKHALRADDSNNESGPSEDSNPDDDALGEGRRVFAKGCIACHSSKQPDYPGLVVKTNDSVDPLSARTLTLDDLWQLTRGTGELPADYARWAKQAVTQPEFWEDNYLSTDMRIPVTMTQTNSARAMATNAKHGHVWEDFASNTFKELPSVGQIRYRDPFSLSTKTYSARGGGPGYYRVPSLVSAWATAPFLHNNSLGNFNNDPSVAGRLAAFDDAINKLLYPEKRNVGNHDRSLPDPDGAVDEKQLQSDGGLIWRTSRETHFTLLGHQVPVFLSGYTGFSPFWIRLLPWLPPLLLLLLAVLLLIRNRFTRISNWFQRQTDTFGALLVGSRVVAFLLLSAVALAVARVTYLYYSAFRMLETASNLGFPWITVQLVLTALVLLAFALLIFFRQLRSKKRFPIFFILTAIVFALGLGRFASGYGGNWKVGPFPAGMPVSLIANIDPEAPLPDLKRAVDALAAHMRQYGSKEERHDQTSNDRDQRALADFEFNVAPLLLKVSKCPDMVLDRGHDYKFMQQFSDQEKQALIQLIKTF